MGPHSLLLPLAVAVLGVAACSSDDSDGGRPSSILPATVPSGDTATEQRFPDVVGANAVRVGDTWTISATLSSPYDTPERYADAWRVLGADGTVYGERILAHDHANEQPFTRSQTGIDIPDDVTEVVIEGRDLEYGYGGATYTLTLPG